jgi:hypothetical protein
LSDNEGEKLYRDANERESFGAEALIPTAGFVPCWDTWASPPPQDTGSRESHIQGGWNSRQLQTSWSETYRNSHQNVGAITWNEFKARFRTHYVPHGTLKLKKKEFSKLQQDRMTVNEYINKFTQMSRYAPDDVNTDEKKQDAFLNGLNDEIQFQLLNTDYKDF